MRFSSLSEWLSWQETLHPSAIDLGLERLHRTLQRLGWRRPAHPFLTIGGTNGKGSCAALSAAILKSAGYRVGVFSSPHLIRYQERITIDGCEAADAALIDAFERIDAARGADTLTFFEFNTLAALLLFEAAALDVVVLEVGMGGRLDAVNIVDADAALVTSIALDHCEWLGNDLETIGREKAGIFRANRPAVFGSRGGPASVEEVARSAGADFLQLGRDFDWTRTRERWSWRGRTTAYDDLPHPALLGDVQLDNAASVLCLLESIADRLPVDRAAVEHGLTNVHLPGRFQQIGREPEWILDVAHNPAAAHTLAAQLAARPISGKTIGVCGILGDKDVEGVATALRNEIDDWIVAGLSGGRAMPPALIAERLARIGLNVTATADDVRAACSAARSAATPDDRIVVFGSFLTVGPALDALSPSRDVIT